MKRQFKLSSTNRLPCCPGPGGGAQLCPHLHGPADAWRCSACRPLLLARHVLAPKLANP